MIKNNNLKIKQVFVIEISLLFLLGLNVGMFFEALWGVLVFLFCTTLAYLLFRLAKDAALEKKAPILINTLLEAIIFGICFSVCLKKTSLNMPNWKMIVLCLVSMAALYIPFWIKNSIIHIKKIEPKGQNQNCYLRCSIAVLVVLLVAFFYLPIEVFLNNSDEFAFSFFDALYSLLPFFIAGLLLLSVLSLLPAAFSDWLFVIFSTLSLAAYVQFMFFNQYIGQMNGDIYRWKEHIIHSVLNIFAWLVIIVFGCLFGFIKKKKRVLLFADCALGVLVTVSFLFLVVKAPKEAFLRKQFYLSGKEQFTIGKEENVVLLIADAVDNKVIKEILEKEPETFDDFHDFTLYTDTCSVYDLTGLSMNQVLYGYTQRKNSEHAVSFMKCFAQKGYRILFFFGAGKAVGTEEMPNTYIDNYVFSEDTKSILEVKYGKIRRGFGMITLYRVTPCLLKSRFGRFTADFNHTVLYNGGMDELISENQKFMDHLHLRYNDVSDRCFVYQHIDGAHFPCDDYYRATKESLEIYGEYIRQLKELNVYEDSLIIIASDHGVHDDVDNVPFPTATTPMLMIKKPKEEHESIEFSNRPVYHQDFQASILKYAGICDEEEILSIYGKTFDDYDETLVRTRVWFDTGFNGQKTRKYKYSGDTSELERVVKEGIYEEVDSLEFDFGELE